MTARPTASSSTAERGAERSARRRLTIWQASSTGVAHGSATLASDPDRILRDHTELGLDITTKTARSTWLGERCDYDTAIIGLLQKEWLAAEDHNRDFATAA